MRNEKTIEKATEKTANVELLRGQDAAERHQANPLNRGLSIARNMVLPVVLATVLAISPGIGRVEAESITTNPKQATAAKYEMMEDNQHSYLRLVSQVDNIPTVSVIMANTGESINQLISDIMSKMQSAGVPANQTQGTILCYANVYVNGILNNTDTITALSNGYIQVGGNVSQVPYTAPIVPTTTTTTPTPTPTTTTPTPTTTTVTPTTIPPINLPGDLGISDVTPSGAKTIYGYQGWQGPAVYNFAAAGFVTPYLTTETQMDNWNFVLFRTARVDSGVTRPVTAEIQALTAAQCSAIKSGNYSTVIPTPTSTTTPIRTTTTTTTTPTQTPTTTPIQTSTQVLEVDLLDDLGMGVSASTASKPAWLGWQGPSSYNFAAAGFTTPYLTSETQMDNWNYVLFRTARVDSGITRPITPEIKALTAAQCSAIKSNNYLTSNPTLALIIGSGLTITQPPYLISHPVSQTITINSIPITLQYTLPTNPINASALTDQLGNAAAATSGILDALSKLLDGSDTAGALGELSNWLGDLSTGISIVTKGDISGLVGDLVAEDGSGGIPIPIPVIIPGLASSMRNFVQMLEGNQTAATNYVQQKKSEIQSIINFLRATLGEPVILLP